MQGVSREEGAGDPLERDKPNGAGNAGSWAGGAPRVRALLWGGVVNFCFALKEYPEWEGAHNHRVQLLTLHRTIPKITP